MNFGKCTVENFASYKELTFDFAKQGLTLIQGATGSGKSTLCDVIPWILFGKTAKGGSVDDVLSWPGDQPAKGTITVNGITITRIRSPKAKDNDLYFTDDGKTVRGKDLNDTQKLINTKLGLDYSLYLSGGYVHEFSDTAAFFMTTPKNRRAICEQLVDLTLAKSLQTVLAEDKKKAKHSLDLTQNSLMRLETRIELLQANYVKGQELLANFDADKEANIATLLAKFEAYEQNRIRVTKELTAKQASYVTDLAALGGSNEPCPHCGAKKNDTVHAVLTEKLKHLRNELKKWETNENPHVAAIEREQTRVNNYEEELASIEADLTLRLKQHDAISKDDTAQRQAIGDLSLLEDALSSFRSAIVLNTINSLQTTTNALLTKHFDAEIQVEFEVTNDVDVNITKDGNACSYGQLSKGQRQLLKLCFAVAAMRQVSNYQGVAFPQIFFDEAFDGLGDTMKVKAFGLLQALELEYESIFVVEHSETLKALFTNQYQVELIDGSSIITAT